MSLLCQHSSIVSFSGTSWIGPEASVFPGTGGGGSSAFGKVFCAAPPSLMQAALKYSF